VGIAHLHGLYTGALDFWLDTSVKCFAAILLLLGVSTQAAQDLTPNIVTANAAPDEVATSLMPVPIFNFAVHNVAFSPDGTILATGDGTGMVRLWNTQTGELGAAVQAHTNWAFSVAWSPDGKSFVTGGGDDAVRSFDAGNLTQPLKTFLGHSNDVHAVAITGDGRNLVSAGDDRHIIVWELATGKELLRWRAHDGQIPTVTIGPDGATVASGSRDDSIRAWELKSGRLKHELIGHTEDVLSVRFSPDGKSLASTSYDGTVRLWDAISGRAIRIFKGHTNRVFSAAFSPDGSRLASAGDSTLRIWDATTGRQINVITPGGAVEHGGNLIAENLSAVAFSPDGTMLAVTSTTGATTLLEAATGKVLQRLVPNGSGPAKLRP
jgi:WD40 repeat protein